MHDQKITHSLSTRQFALINLSFHLTISPSIIKYQFNNQYYDITTYSTFLIQYTVAPRSFLTLFACSVYVTCVYYTGKLHTQKNCTHCECTTWKNYTHSECTTQKKYTHSEYYILHGKTTRSVCTTRKNYTHCASSTPKLYIMQSACSKLATQSFQLRRM